MKFRPCIDIHNGKVKQIVGSSLKDEDDYAKENFVSTQNAEYYSKLYRQLNLSGGHIILLNNAESKFYQKTKEQAHAALRAYPGGLQVGGGITPENAPEYIDHGASHVIVTSYVFRDGRIVFKHLKKMVDAVGKKHLVLDLSCRKLEDNYYIVTNRWQKYTDLILSKKTMEELSTYCDEFLIHAVDVEGKNNGIETQVLSLLSDMDNIPITYAGGIRSLKDIELIRNAGNQKIDVTIGSALDLFGGPIKLKEVLEYINNANCK